MKYSRIVSAMILSIVCMSPLSASNLDEERGFILFNRITDLNLSSCKIDDETADLLSAHLVKNSSIQRITLSDNPFSDKGLLLLARSLGTMTSLYSLQLGSHPNVTDDGYEQLFDTLNSSTSLSFISIKSTPLGTESLERLQALLKNKPGLVADISFQALKDHALLEILKKTKPVSANH